MTNSRLNWNSSRLTSGPQKGVTAFYYGLGMTADDFERPQIGIGCPLLDGNLCNMHAYDLAKAIADGCQSAGLIGLPFGTPAVSDNITQGHEGGSASLPSRNMIANAAEAVVSGHGYDGLIGLHCCDKNGPGFAMALARMNYPGLVLSGGSILPGRCGGKNVTILDVYDTQAAAAVGAMSQDQADEVLRTACPGAGGCGIAASFNTWGIAMEAIGLMPPNSSSIPAVDPLKKAECESVGSLMRTLLENDIRPRDILTEAAFRNCAVAVAAAGGSTNGILHILALAREAGIPFGLKEIQPLMQKTPVLANFAPRGEGTMYDLHQLGGTSALLKHFIDGGLLDGSCLTVTGKTLAENVADAPAFDTRQTLVAPNDKPFKAFADIQIAFGNIAPDGMVFKVSSLRDSTFSGTALCFEDPLDIVAAVNRNEIKPGSVIILRGWGPVAAGMPEVLVASAALATPELDGRVAFLSDTRVSGVSHGAIGVHCAPEAVVGGPIGQVRDGDPITFNLLDGTIHVDADLASRPTMAREVPQRRGYLADFCATVDQADAGCVSKFLMQPTAAPAASRLP